jgi:hypothetical protein
MASRSQQILAGGLHTGDGVADRRMGRVAAVDVAYRRT